MIAIGRYMLAALLVFYLWIDTSPALDPASMTFAVLGAYSIFALIVMVVTWDDWWLEARLAGPAHAVDIIAFALLVYSTQGFDSPYFTLFIFIVGASAIRWGLRATSLTSVLLIGLFYMVGMLVFRSTGPAHFEDFVDRTGHLIILSMILIWFGVNQWRSGLYSRSDPISPDSALDESPLETSLRAAMEGLNASSGVLIWREHGRKAANAFVARNGGMTVVRTNADALMGFGAGPFLYNNPKNRALARDDRRNLCPFKADELINGKAAAELGLEEGIAIPFRTGGGEGEVFLEGMPNLSTDHIDLGRQIALDVVGQIERHALIIAVEESAEARSRLGLARDLHDSVVQFLAGAAFRLEALKRDLASGRDLEPELNYLKQLMLHEQGELRSFIAALRSAPQIGLDELAKDLRSLAERLAEQWNVLCEFSAQTTDMMVPSRLHLDAQHLVREAVANAVRHAGAKSVTIRLQSDTDQLKLDFINDGSRYPKTQLTGGMPRSLSERVKLAGGALELTRGMGVTRISVSLPISGRIH
ncbi:sensor histidine kinase [Sphingomonas daechungensis]|uniref:sensor histidine kinase n=1 Tax=Sphingomonas daechungensis TaxID=1176646 RepID=UPI0037830267